MSETTTEPKPTRYFSVARFGNHNVAYFSVGGGIGWDKDGRTACLILNILFWTVFIGPHHPPKDRIL